MVEVLVSASRRRRLIRALLAASAILLIAGGVAAAGSYPTLLSYSHYRGAAPAELPIYWYNAPNG
jgi:hypothetical protein